MYELQGVDEKTAREAFRLAGHKLPVGYKFLTRGEIVMKAADLREKSVEDLRELQKTLARDVFQNRLKNFTNRLDDTSSIRKTQRDLARVVTLLARAQTPGAAPGHGEGRGDHRSQGDRAAEEAPAKPRDGRRRSARRSRREEEDVRQEERGEVVMTQSTQPAHGRQRVGGPRAAARLPPQDGRQGRRARR